MSRVAERGDAKERAARPGEKWRAAYWTMLGGAAPNCGPGDHRSARVFLSRIEAAIDRGGWTRNEWRNLSKLHERWTARAYGDDPRFEFAGIKAGRLPRDTETYIKTRRQQIALRDHLRVAQIVRTVDAADPRVRPAPSTLRARQRARNLHNR